MRIGVFVGSFDPVHNGHVAIMKYLVKEKIVDLVLVIPTGNYWNKQDLTDLKKRIEMLKLISDNNILIDQEHNFYEYTYQILESLTNENNENKYYLIMGIDNYEKIHLWKNYQDILDRGIIVVNRDCHDIGNIDDNIIFVNKDFGDVSSSKIRKRIRDNNYEDINGFLDKKVLEYIIENDLYR